MPAASDVELGRLRQLTARIGGDPLLTQASTGNSSHKACWRALDQGVGQVDGRLHEPGFLHPLNMAEVSGGCLRRGLDPAGRYLGASIETAMRAVLPHRVVVLVHSVNTIAWVIRDDAAVQFQHQLEGLRWQWIPYVVSGPPLSRAIELSLRACPDTEVFVLGNHGLVVGGEDCNAVEDLLREIELV